MDDHGFPYGNHTIALQTHYAGSTSLGLQDRLEVVYLKGALEKDIVFLTATVAYWWSHCCLLTLRHAGIPHTAWSGA